MGGASFYDLINMFQPFRIPFIIGMAVLPAISWAGGKLFMKLSKKASARFLAIPVFVSVIPGVCCSVAIAYLLLIARVNVLREVDLLLCGGPILCMAATLFAISKIMSFDDIPGFDKLSGLVITVTVAFIVVLMIAKTRIFVGFFASIKTLIIFFFILFVILQIGLAKIKKK